MDNILEEVEAFGLSTNTDVKDIINFIINRPYKNREALIVSHLGLGDSLNINGAIRYILYFYNKVNIIAKPHYTDNVKNIYSDNPDINIITGNDRDIPNIISKFNGCDIYSLSFAYKSNISHPFLSSKFNKTSYCKHFISDMYKNANLDISIYNDYFKLQSTSKSKELHNKVKDYQVVFLHENTSNQQFNFNRFITYNDNELLVCSNRNIYTEGVKKEIAELFVNIHIIDYYDTIINASKIIISDSCFSSMILPLVNNGVVKTDDITIIHRRDHLFLKTMCSKIKCISG
jgi:hypothetical protein